MRSFNRNARFGRKRTGRFSQRFRQRHRSRAPVQRVVQRPHRRDGGKVKRKRAEVAANVPTSVQPSSPAPETPSWATFTPEHESPRYELNQWAADRTEDQDIDLTRQGLHRPEASPLRPAEHSRAGEYRRANVKAGCLNTERIRMSRLHAQHARRPHARCSVSQPLIRSPPNPQPAAPHACRSLPFASLPRKGLAARYLLFWWVGKGRAGEEAAIDPLWHMDSLLSAVLRLFSGFSSGPENPSYHALSRSVERWVRSVKHECLSKLILFGEGSLKRAKSSWQRQYTAVPRRRTSIDNRRIVRTGSRAAWRSPPVLRPGGCMNILTLRVADMSANQNITAFVLFLLTIIR
jgi:hypothetical protein